MVGSKEIIRYLIVSHFFTLLGIETTIPPGTREGYMRNVTLKRMLSVQKRAECSEGWAWHSPLSHINLFFLIAQG